MLSFGLANWVVVVWFVVRDCPLGFVVAYGLVVCWFVWFGCGIFALVASVVVVGVLRCLCMLVLG